MAHAARLTRPAPSARTRALSLLLCAWLLSSASQAATLDAGFSHNLAITPAGEVRAWGSNEYGQLGNSSTFASSALVRSGTLTGVVAVAAGGFGSLALRSDTTVWAWGHYPTLGQAAPHQCLIPNSFSSTPVYVACAKSPLQVPGLSGIVAIAVGASHAVALRSNGTLAAWGDNTYGQLGDGTTTTRTAPVNVSLLTGVVAIAAGEGFTLALKGDGTVWSWGVGTHGELGYIGPHTCPAGDPYNNLATTSPCARTPFQVVSITGVTAISTRGRHVLALKGDGSVWAWGSGRYGQLGNSTTSNSFGPIAVPGMAPAARIEAGFSQSFVVKSDGTFWAFGLNGLGGLLGFTQFSGTNCPPGFENYCWSFPVAVPAFNEATQVVSGGSHTLVVRPNGAIATFGNNNSGQRAFGLGPFYITQLSSADPHVAFGAGATSSGGSLGTASSGGGLNLGALDEGLRFSSSGVNIPSAPAEVRFTNLQETAVGILSVGITGNFSRTHDCPASLPSFSHCTIQVTFTPTGTGERLGTLSVTTNSPESPTVSLELSGSTPQVTYDLAIAKLGTGNGTVSSSPAGLSCGSTCSLGFVAGTTVVLAAAAAGGSTFGGWDGACSGTGSCSVSMNEARAVTAAFNTTPVGNAPRSSPTAAFFGSQLVGAASPARTLTISNPGPSAFTISSVVANGPYAVTHGCATLAAAGSCTVSVVFTPLIEGLANATLTVSSNAGSLVVPLSGTGVDPPRLGNIATRGPVYTGDNVMIGGFIIGGSSPKTVLVRARGPSMAQFNVPNLLANPQVTLYQGQTPLLSNDNWGQATNAAAIQATGLAPSDPNEAAILTTLGPGPYTAIVSGVGNATGIAIVEVFEVGEVTVPLVNIATRGLVQTGDNVLIGGFIIDGSGPQTIVVRARGPSMAQFNVPNLLANPQLTLYQGQTPIASNDNWQAAPNLAALQASGQAPTDPNEAAILMTLQPGGYTAIVTGVGGGSGIAIVEVFKVP